MGKTNKRPIAPNKYHQMQVSTSLLDRLARLKRKHKFKTYDELLRNDYGLPPMKNNTQTHPPPAKPQESKPPEPEKHNQIPDETCPFCGKNIMQQAIQSAKNQGDTTFKCYHCQKPIDISNWSSE